MSTEERIKTSWRAICTGWLVDDVDEDYPLLEKQVVDSLGMITLISLLEDEFDVEIDDGDVVPGNFRTIRQIAALVESKQA